MSALAGTIPDSDLNKKISIIEKEFNIKNAKIASAVFVVFTGVIAGLYIYLGASGDSFPAWGSPFLMTLGSLQLVSSSGFLLLNVSLLKGQSFNTPEKKLARKALITGIMIDLLEIIASATYIYLGASGNSFPAWGSPFLVTMGSLKIICDAGYCLFLFSIVKKIILELAKKEKDSTKENYVIKNHNRK